MSRSSDPEWRKSSHSGHDGGDCVEVARLSDGIGVRDSKNPTGHVHTFEGAAFRALVHAIRG